MEEKDPVVEQPVIPTQTPQPEVLSIDSAPKKNSKSLMFVIGGLVLVAIVVGAIFLIAYPRGNSSNQNNVTATASKEINSNADLDKVSGELDKADSDFTQIDTDLNLNDQDANQF